MPGKSTWGRSSGRDNLAKPPNAALRRGLKLRMGVLSLTAVTELQVAFAESAEVVLEDIRASYWSEFGDHCSDVAFAGSGDAGAVCRALLMFDLSGVPPTVTSAILRVEIESFWSTAPEECFVVHDVIDSDIDALLNGDDSLAIFDDLGDGAFYSDEICVTEADEGSIIEILLLQPAVDDINGSTTGYLSIGTRLTTLDGSKEPLNLEGVRFGTGDPSLWTNELVLTFQPQVLRCW